MQFLRSPLSCWPCPAVQGWIRGSAEILHLIPLLLSPLGRSLWNMYVCGKRPFLSAPIFEGTLTKGQT